MSTPVNTWTPGTPPSAAGRAAAAVQAINGTANTAKANADNAQTVASAAQDTAGSAQSSINNVIDGTTVVSPDTIPTLPGNKIGTALPAGLAQAIPSGHIAAVSPELLYAPNFGLDFGNSDTPQVVFTAGVCTITANGTALGAYSNGIAVSQGQLLTIRMSASWTGLTYTNIAPIRFDIVAYWRGAPVQALTIADVESPAASGSTSIVQGVQIGTGIDVLVVRPFVGPNASAGAVKFTAPSVSQSAEIPSSSIGSVDFSIVTNPIGAGAENSSVGYALQNTWDTMHVALGGDATSTDGGPVTPSDVADLLNTMNATAQQAYEVAMANRNLIITLQQQVAALQNTSTPTPPSTRTPKLYKFTTTQTWHPPWDNATITAVALGGGGSSGSGGARNDPGSPGKWASLGRAVGYSASETWTITPGAGGVAPASASGIPVTGGPGGATTIKRGASTVLTAAGGAGGAAHSTDTGGSLSGPGPSPSSKAIAAGYTAAAGGAVAANTAGAMPGGAAGGSLNFFSNNTKNGAPGTVWIVVE